MRKSYAFPVDLTQAGFTLIEVIAAVVILAILSVMTARVVTETFANKKKYQYEMTRDATLRDTMRVIQNDVAAAFNFQDFSYQIYREILEQMQAERTQQQKPSADGRPPGPQSPADQTQGQPPPTGQQRPIPTPKPTPVQLTHFVGMADAMYFTIGNHTKTVYGARESDLARVGYYLGSCKSRNPQTLGKATQCLFRSMSTSLIEDVARKARETRLAEGVAEFKLRYIPADAAVGEKLEDVLVETWRSDGKSQDGKLGFFPLAVEVSLTLHDKNDTNSKPVSLVTLNPIRFPNNPTEKKETQNAIPGR